MFFIWVGFVTKFIENNSEGFFRFEYYGSMRIIHFKPLSYTESTCMEQTKRPIFASYRRNPDLYDEIFNDEGAVKDIYKELFDLYGGIPWMIIPA